jgi:hypothetical protein
MFPFRYWTLGDINGRSLWSSADLWKIFGEPLGFKLRVVNEK